MAKATKTRGHTFSNRLSDYMIKKRLPKSFSWVGVLAVLWQHYYLNFVVEFLAIFLGAGVLLPLLGVSVESIRIGSLGGDPIKSMIAYLIYVFIFTSIWIALKFGWKLYKQTTGKKEMIIAKDGTLRERSPSQWSLVWRRFAKNRV